MTGRLDWAKILAMFTLGGYTNSAVLSDGTALLALTGLTLMQESWLWEDYTDADDIQEAIALAIDEIVNGTAGNGDMIKIAEVVAVADCASLTIDNFDAGTFRAYELHIQGLKSNYAGNWADHVKLTINSETTATDYNCFGRFYTNSGQLQYENIGTYAGIALVWAAPTSVADDQAIGDVRIHFPDPQGDDYKRCNYQASGFADVASRIYWSDGVGFLEKTDMITEIMIELNSGTSFLIDPASATDPSELRMTLYGLQ